MPAAKKSVAIVQSNYIPWKGYFDLINSVDEFILYDDAQYTRRDWRNRNMIKTPEGKQWLTIPVDVKGKYEQRIIDTKISVENKAKWGVKHWHALTANYSQTPFFHDYAPIFEELYHRENVTQLSEVNFSFLSAINKILGITTHLTWSMDYGDLGEGPTTKILKLCQAIKADHYLSGPSAQSYLDVAMLNQDNISVEYFDYSGYPEYDQRFPPFDHAVSVLDLIFNVGPDARAYMKSFSAQAPKAKLAG